MRNALFDELFKIAETDDRIYLLVGDLGFSVVEPFAEKHPDRFFNAGIAEQNMIGTAAGLALTGDKTVFVYSIGNFPVIRPLEQIRNDVCYHNANVKIICPGGGAAYGAQGYTHHAVEDLAVMRAMPGMTIAAPADPLEARAAVRLACETEGPWYIRLGRNREPNIHDQLDDLSVGRILQLTHGGDGAILVTGPIATEAVAAAKELAAQGLHVSVYSVPFVKPLDGDVVRQLASESPWLITLEEHSLVGGLGSAVAEIVAEFGGSRLSRLALPEHIDALGSQEYIRRRCDLDAPAIVRKAIQLSQR